MSRRLRVPHVLLTLLAAAPLYVIVFWPFGPPKLPAGCPYLSAQALSNVVPAASLVDSATLILPDRVTCSWQSTGQAVGQGATVTLGLSVVRSTASTYRGAGHNNAQATFVQAMKSGSYGQHDTYAVPGLGDAAFAAVVDSTVPRVGNVTVGVLRGIDVYTVTYSAVPTNRDLALAAAVAATRDLITAMESIE